MSELSDEFEQFKKRLKNCISDNIRLNNDYSVEDKLDNRKEFKIARQTFYNILNGKNYTINNYLKMCFKFNIHPISLFMTDNVLTEICSNQFRLKIKLNTYELSNRDQLRKALKNKKFDDELIENAMHFDKKLNNKEYGKNLGAVNLGLLLGADLLEMKKKS